MENRKRINIVVLSRLIGIVGVLGVFFLLIFHIIGKKANPVVPDNGYIIRYLDRQVAMVSIRVKTDEPEEKTQKLLDAAKKEIEKTDILSQKDIDYTLPLKPTVSLTEEGLTEEGITIKKFLVILQLPDPNSTF